jgi:hypothetical protein
VVGINSLVDLFRTPGTETPTFQWPGPLCLLPSLASYVTCGFYFACSKRDVQKRQGALREAKHWYIYRIIKIPLVWQSTLFLQRVA